MIIYIVVVVMVALVIEVNGYSLIDNDHDNIPNQQNKVHNPYHGLSEVVANKIFMHKLNVWRNHYRNFTKEQIQAHKKRFELVDSYVSSKYVSSKSTAVLWRCHNPTDNAIIRIQNWAKEFEKNKAKSGIKYNLYISMDISAGTEYYLETKRKLEGYDILFHTYTNLNMSNDYPILIEMLRRVPPYFFDHSLSLAKGFHIESICLWWLWILNTMKTSYDYVWVLEDDIGITGGSLYDFIHLYDNKDWKKQDDDYENNSPDLITYGKYYTSKNDHDSYHDRWVYHDTVSNEYSLLMHEREQFYTQEHMQRFSARYINLLHYYIKVHKITAWSEQFSISIITHLKPKWRVGYIAYENIGQYEVIKRISQTKFESMQLIETNSTISKNQIKLWHALKW